MKSFETFVHKGFTVALHQDTDPGSPRDWDNLGQIVTWHRRYRLGDKHDYADGNDFRKRTKDSVALVLPVYLYDHSGLRVNTTGFHCPWDSGQVGYIWVSKERLQKEYGSVTPETIEQARKVLIGEIETFDQYLRGDVWGYVIYGPDGGELDSCWGFHGLEYAKGEATSAVDYAADHVAELVAQPGEH